MMIYRESCSEPNLKKAMIIHDKKNRKGLQERLTFSCPVCVLLISLCCAVVRPDKNTLNASASIPAYFSRRNLSSGGKMRRNRPLLRFSKSSRAASRRIRMSMSFCSAVNSVIAEFIRLTHGSNNTRGLYISQRRLHAPVIQTHRHTATNLRKPVGAGKNTGKKKAK